MTNCEAVLKYLRGKGFTPSGTIARDVHVVTGSKEATIERCMRSMEAQGILVHDYKETGVHYVSYKIKEAQPKLL